MITCMKMKSFILKYASKIMFYDVTIACYQRERKDVMTKCVFIGESMNKNIKRKYLEMP